MNKSHPHRDAALALENDGKLELALQAFLRANLPSDAGRVARKLGRQAQAGQLFAGAGLHYEAAVCFAEAGDKAACLTNLIRVPRTHKFYRACCVKAIGLAAQAKDLSMELDHFVKPFICSSPENEAEQQALVRIGKLYEDEDFPDSALQAYRSLLTVVSGHPVSQRVAVLQQALRPTKAGGQTRMLRTPGGASMAGGLPDLPSLPPPPNLAPPPPAPTAPTMSAAKPSAAGAAQPTVVSGRGAQAPGAAPPPPPPPPTAAASGAQTQLSASAIRPGDVIAERYHIVDRIGEGGMAAVFRAKDTELDEDVAIKVFAGENTDAEIVGRFKQELALARKLAHPNVLRMYDIGIDRGCRFITMELLQGQSLRDALRSGQVTLRMSLDLLSQACAGLQAAHDQGVVHRDIKPENLFVTAQGVLKVMDFGIAKNLTATNKTRVGVTAGTAAYMSPEQIEGFSNVSHLTDLYALGIVAYELCTGRPPFFHEEMFPLFVMQMTQIPEPPMARNPNIPPALNELILKLLEKDPKLRVQSARELGAAFDRLRGAA